ncbi:hypothetical protein MKW92_012168 [Papaver armeniacum]|nr:hypothetical protein MKW92_012168 [Papaver armeniacum]
MLNAYIQMFIAKRKIVKDKGADHPQKYKCLNGFERRNLMKLLTRRLLVFILLETLFLNKQFQVITFLLILDVSFIF